MRIIAGRYGGRRLSSFEAKHLRPTTDRTKESLFGRLTPHLEGARVLDLFSGTGSLGLEALSRGAAYVDFVEQHRKSLNILRKNIRALDLPGSVYQVHSQDVFKFLKNYKGEPYQIIFADPPFTEKIADAVGQAVANSVVGGPGSLWVMESGGSEPLAEGYGSWESLYRKSFGDKVLSFFIIPE